jgi:hypothetical protein
MGRIQRNFYDLICLIGVVCGCLVSINAQTTRSYRGSLGGNHIEMRLSFTGDKISGSYFYDQFRKDLTLSGVVSGDGKWELTEFAPGGKKTGKFVCKPAKSRFEIDLECEWTKPTGKAQSTAWLSEQHLSLPVGLKLTPKVINRVRSNTTVSYPQLTGTGVSPKAIAGFNLGITKLTNEAMKEFYPEPPPARTAYDANYTVMFASADVVSIEMNEYTNSGGAHPNTRVWGFNYSLAKNRELKLEDLFKRGSEFETALKQYCVAEINRHADFLDAEETRLNGKPAVKRDEPIMSDEMLSGISDFAITPDGIAIYFEFPHVMAVFNKVFVPYSEIKNYLDPRFLTAETQRGVR